MARQCTNCGSGIGGMFGAQLIDPALIKQYQQLIECPEELCTKCDGGVTQRFEQAKRQQKAVDRGDFESMPPEVQAKIAKLPVVSIETLPPIAKYKLVDMVSYQSTLGTGLISELSSDVSNITGGEAHALNNKMSVSVEKCKQAMRLTAFKMGANAVIGTAFQVSSNTRDATTVAAQGTAVFIENLSDVFLSA